MSFAYHTLICHSPGVGRLFRWAARDGLLISLFRLLQQTRLLWHIPAHHRVVHPVDPLQLLLPNGAQARLHIDDCAPG